MSLTENRGPACCGGRREGKRGSAGPDYEPPSSARDPPPQAGRWQPLHLSKAPPAHGACARPAPRPLSEAAGHVTRHAARTTWRGKRGGCGGVERSPLPVRRPRVCRRRLVPSRFSRLGRRCPVSAVGPGIAREGRRRFPDLLSSPLSSRGNSSAQPLWTGRPWAESLPHPGRGVGGSGLLGTAAGRTGSVRRYERPPPPPSLSLSAPSSHCSLSAPGRQPGSCLPSSPPPQLPVGMVRTGGSVCVRRPRTRDGPGRGSPEPR